MCQCKMDPKNVHHVVFSAPSVETCTLEVSTIDATDASRGESNIEANSHFVCEAMLRLDTLPCSSTPQVARQELLPCLKTWRHLLTSERQELVLCDRRKTEQLRARRNNKMKYDLIDIIGGYFCRVGLTVKALLQMAKRLGPTVENCFRASVTIECNELDDGDGVASLGQVEELLRVASAKGTCVEEIIGYFRGLSLHRVDFFEIPDCGGEIS